MNSSVEFAQFKAQLIKDLTRSMQRPGMTIFDIGCGNGLMTFYLQELFFDCQVIGIDTDEKAIRKAREQYPELSFMHVMAIEQITNQADIVVVGLVLHHIPEKKQSAFVRSLMHGVNPHGVCVILELNPYRPDVFLMSYFDTEEKDAHFITAKKVRRWLKEYTTEVSYYCFFPAIFGFLSQFESYMSKIMFGRLYAIVVYSKNAKSASVIGASHLDGN